MKQKTKKNSTRLAKVFFLFFLGEKNLFLLGEKNLFLFVLFFLGPEEPPEWWLDLESERHNEIMTEPESSLLFEKPSCSNSTF
jgi:hypothetical protein